MIDAKDNGTQPLDLGEAPKRRGRPATGKALSNADRQRAYRERQKAQRNVKSDVGTTGAIKLWEEACRNLGKANDRIRELEQQMVQQREEYNDLVHKLMTERDQLKRDLAAKPRRHRDQPAAELPETAYDDEQESWAVFGKKTIRAKKWTRLTPDGKEYASEKEAMTTGLAETDSLGPNSVYTARKVT